MSFRQAYHTSCRRGLAGVSGFQINAASPALTGEQLSALAAEHARYEAPPDAPYEPSPEQIRGFPVALKASVVAGVGPVVSRTVYVGREYRGRNGEPDEGRFGNYFCHMVIGRDGDDEPFGGPLAVELWDATHWSIDEADGTELPELPELTAGPVTLEAVAPLIVGAPSGVAAALLDATMHALLAEGPTVMLIDLDHRRAALWIAFLTYALPPALARTLTFSTYEGRPGDISGLHVVATMPSCDPGPALARRVARVDVSQPTDVEPSLYARVALHLLAEDPEALAGAVRRMPGHRPEELGVGLAVAGRAVELVRDPDLDALVRVLQAMVARGRVAEAAEAAEALGTSTAADERVIRQWFDLYVAARTSTAGDAARQLASTALVRLVAHLDSLPDDLPPLREAMVNPAVKGTGAWASAVQAAAGTDRAARFIRLGVPLGLLGINVPVDGRIAAVLAQDVRLPSTQDAIAAIAADGSLDHVLEQMTALVLEDPVSDTRTALIGLARHEAIARALERRAHAEGTFAAQFDWQQVRISRDPGVREEAARALTPLVRTEDERRAVRTLWGPNGPTAPRETMALLRAYLDVGVDPWPRDVEDAFQQLLRAPLRPAASPAEDLGTFLGHAFPTHAGSRDGFVAWWAATHAPIAETRVRKWLPYAVRGLRASAEEVPDERWWELMDVVAETVVRFRMVEDLRWMLDELRGVDQPNLLQALGARLAKVLDGVEEQDKAVAQEFARWMQVAPREAESVLPVAFASLSARDVERVEKQFNETGAERWRAWLERHPRASGRAKIARSLGFRGKDRR